MIRNAIIDRNEENEMLDVCLLGTGGNDASAQKKIDIFNDEI